MNKKDKEEIGKVVVEALNEVVIPVLENMGDQIDELKMSNDRIERKLDAQQNRSDRQGKQLVDHRERIQILEAAVL
ncbi:hypothetical protein A2630_04510 [Candidatus Woesebacteria bacterium RIFCSPHIGHO2_01_FULL_44_10]|uniref:Uncharacterized protein n=1 Tax=Candidatus Woesebacteria bacterium RIFCSPLOWO2_01_FULL_44_14 TaxID=1802525 RepID=A0A1F8C380_9BACT|nr:MAG: hypothetical protein A2630_04510 [Candidatus Woesebacteria bacterium RIFCSPHIGHO2_01_FULL_44_10]OGM56041.1 MAG: hypothetical protein A3F62_03935 [Candidatus Woesebacteria bacterium RIFCSPHIGHO2_12_FULL_44_11]OGM70764.1 MAG: hypothetical protein A2975_02645 [Candidatus Woesebacteria bacterium RIFCSPLOWO2_01_FULL_44_14]